MVRFLLSEDEIREGVERLARQVTADFQGLAPTIISVLTGSLVLLADLIRRLELPLRVGVVQAASYRGKATDPGRLEIHPELIPDIRGRDVLLLDDIFDTGKTLAGLMEHLRQLEPASLHSAVLLRKEGRQEVEMEPDYFEFVIPNVYVVGYGLDYNDEYRHLPYLAALEEEDF